MHIQAETLSQVDTAAMMRAKMFDTFLGSDAPEVEAAIDDMYSQLFHDEVRKRKPSETDVEKRKASIKLMLLNLFKAWHVSPSEWVHISLARDTYSQHPLISYRTIKAVWDGVVRLDYVDYVKGHSSETGFSGSSKRQHGYTTRMKATEVVTSFLQDTHGLTIDMITQSRPRELIVLKDKNKDTIDYKDTPDTIRMRENLKSINALLSKSRIELNIDNDAFKAEQQKRHEAGRKPVDLTSNSLHRIFNRCSFEQGGRFYGAWWVTLPKRLRPHITIDDKPTIEIDYVGMNPAMLFAKEGVKLDFDPYMLEGDMSFVERQTIKDIFTILMFDTKLPKRKPKGWLLQKGVRFKDLMEAIIERHHIIAKHFSKGLSGTLQYEDSCIAEGVLMQLVNQGIPALPVHDSFVVKEDDKEALYQVMKQVFYDQTGVFPELRIE